MSIPPHGVCRPGIAVYKNLAKEKDGMKKRLLISIVFLIILCMCTLSVSAWVIELTETPMDSLFVLTYGENPIYDTGEYSTASPRIITANEDFIGSCHYMEIFSFDSDNEEVVSVNPWDGKLQALKAGSATITVSAEYPVGEFSFASTTVTVLENKIEGLDYAADKTKTDYIAGQCISAADLAIIANYSDGSSVIIADYKFSPTTPLKTTDTTVTEVIARRTLFLRFRLQLVISALKICSLPSTSLNPKSIRNLRSATSSHFRILNSRLLTKTKPAPY